MPGRVTNSVSSSGTPGAQVPSIQVGERPVPAARRITRGAQESHTNEAVPSFLHRGDANSQTKDQANLYLSLTPNQMTEIGAQRGTEDRSRYLATNPATSYRSSGQPARPVSTVRPQSAMALTSASSLNHAIAMPECPPSSLRAVWSSTYNGDVNGMGSRPKLTDDKVNLRQRTSSTSKEYLNYNNDIILPGHQRSRSYGDGVMLGEGYTSTNHKSEKSEDIYAKVNKHQEHSGSTAPGYVHSRPLDHRPQIQTNNKPPSLTGYQNGSHVHTARQSYGQDNLAFVLEEQSASVAENKPRPAGTSYELRNAWQRLYGNHADPPSSVSRPAVDEGISSRKTPTFEDSSRHQNTRQPNDHRSSPQFLHSQAQHQDLYKLTHKTNSSAGTASPPAILSSQERADTPLQNRRSSDFPYGSSSHLSPGQHASVRESPTGQSSSNPDHTSGSNNSSSSSATNKNLSTFKPQKVKSSNLDPAIGPASKYPELAKMTSSQASQQSHSQNKTGLLADTRRTGSRQNLSSPNLVTDSTLFRRQQSNSTSDPVEFNIEKNPSHIGSRFSSAFLDSDYSIEDEYSLKPLDSIFDFPEEVSENGSISPPLHSILPRVKRESGTATPVNMSPRFTNSNIAPPKTPDLLRPSSVTGTNPQLQSNKTAQRSVKPTDKKLQSHSDMQVKEGSKSQSRPNGIDGLSKKHLNYARSRSLDDVRESENDSILSFDIENTILTVEHSDQSEIGTLRSFKGNNSVRAQLNRLEGMYTHVMRSLEGGGHGRRTKRRWSIGSSDTSSLRQHTHHNKHSRISAHRMGSKDVKAIGKRFQRLESHVITLARSVAHLSSELRSQNTLSREIENVKQEIQELKAQSSTFPHAPGNFVGRNRLLTDFERYQGWVPSLTNPRRVNKLTKFFGQEPPLLEIFLKQLGYEKYLKNFEEEHIGMIELPYMTEERLQSIGIPMGPRIRILQEAQLYFKQGNFDIYFV